MISQLKKFPEQCRLEWSSYLDLKIGDPFPMCEAHERVCTAVVAEDGIEIEWGAATSWKVFLNILLFRSKIDVHPMWCMDCPHPDYIIRRAPGLSIR